MTCTDYELQIGDLVDGQALDAPAQGALESHLAGCASCRRMAEDLRAIRAAAVTLEQHVPAPQVWNRIAAAVEADRHRRWWQPVRLQGLAFRQLAAAAVAMVLVAGVGWMAWRDLAPGLTAGRTGAAIAQNDIDAGTDPDLVLSADVDMKTAENDFVQAIAGLEPMADTETTDLDAGTADVFKANLTVVDEAIGQSRAALATAPESEIAQESLLGALRSKVELLQDAVALINEMRRGNQAGAARIVSGQNP